MFRTGFVSLVGRANAGKSTLLNALAGSKLAIVARKAQTTRTTIQAVVNRPDAQIVFVDTPGIHKSATALDRRMMDAVRGATEDRDLLLYLADARTAPREEEAQAIALAAKAGCPVFLVLNKVDLVGDKRLLLQRIEQYQALHAFEDYFPVSALKGVGLEELLSSITARLPEGEPMFPPDYLTDQPERFLVSELVREKILRLTHQEVPHSVAVLVDKWEESARLTRIHATIYVERTGQKAIIIGAGGEMLKRVGTESRLEAEQLLERKIHLELFVKVRENWREDPRFLNELDWRSMSGE